MDQGLGSQETNMINNDRDSSKIDENSNGNHSQNLATNGNQSFHQPHSMTHPPIPTHHQPTLSTLTHPSYQTQKLVTKVPQRELSNKSRSK